jgi:hypothetical protein
MLTTSSVNANYGLTDYTYYSLDGRLSTYYDSGQQTTYFVQKYADMQDAYSMFTYLTLDKRFNITETRDSKYSFYSVYNSEY